MQGLGFGVGGVDFSASGFGFRVQGFRTVSLGAGRCSGGLKNPWFFCSLRLLKF